MMNPLDNLSSQGFTSSHDEVAESAQATEAPIEAALQPWFNDRTHKAPPQGTQRTWESELPRWMATLNPGRTGHEYEKALRYFFETPGVPQQLTELSFDLLLAYRGALALRASSRDRPMTPQAMRGASSARGNAQLGTPGTRALPDHDDADHDDADHDDADHDDASTNGHDNSASARPPASGNLAPATVNIRLTALRQFLVHCASVGQLPALPPDQIRSALRRLSIERRRPYQVLAEREWGDFLMAALAPTHPPKDHPGTAAHTQSDSADSAGLSRARGPWGLSRVERAEMRARGEDHPRHLSLGTPGETTEAVLPSKTPRRSRAGLTGARTAQRDHALLSLALATGLRAIELVSLDVGDLAREWHDGSEDWWLVLPDAKTKGQHGGRTLPVAPTLVKTLLAYVESTGRHWEAAADRQTPLFLSLHGRTNTREQEMATSRSKQRQRTAPQRRLSTTQIREIVDRVEAEWRAMRHEQSDGTVMAGESRNISPHALRHSTALALLEGDGAGRPPASVEHVRGWLGHFDIRTTQGYLAHLDARKHRRPFTITPAAPQSAHQHDDDHGDAPPHAR